MQLTWDDIDRKTKTIRLRPEGSKTDKGRTIALTGELCNLIERRWKARGSMPWVFHRQGLPIGDIRKAWKTACRKAGVPGRLFHDLRRTAARNMRRAGVAERVIMDIVGHETNAMFVRYNIVDESDTRERLHLPMITSRHRIDTTKRERSVANLSHCVSQETQLCSLSIEQREKAIMKIINAKILDPTHLELSQPIPAQPGAVIQISIPDEDEEEHVWRDAAKKHFFDVYDAQDAIYDDL